MSLLRVCGPEEEEAIEGGNDDDAERKFMVSKPASSVDLRNGEGLGEFSVEIRLSRDNRRYDQSRFGILEDRIHRSDQAVYQFLLTQSAVHFVFHRDD